MELELSEYFEALTQSLIFPSLTQLLANKRIFRISYETYRNVKVGILPKKSKTTWQYSIDKMPSLKHIAYPG
jgi:hypothetical protein